MVMLLFVPFLAESNAADQNTPRQLPWEIIAEKLDAKKLLCRAKNKEEKTNNYAFTPDALTARLTSNFRITREQTVPQLDLSVWRDGQWVELPTLSTNIDLNGMTVDSDAIKKGFYDLSTVFNGNNFDKEGEFYAVVTPNWKKDMLSWCRKNKDQIEADPDPQLIYSSIAISHFDNLMELVIDSQVLSENVLSALSKAVKAKTDFKGGKCPDFLVGLNKIRVKRFEGSLVGDFVVYVPDSYDKSEPIAVFLHPDNRRWGAKDNYMWHSGLIDVWWNTVDDKNVNWKNFEYFFGILKQKLNIDENRVYVRGECGNGLALMSLALNFPDQWAECSASLGNTYRYLAGNALNLPLIFVKGIHNRESAVIHYNFVVECFKYYGCRFFRHSRPLNIEEVRGYYVPTEVRDLSPYRVYYKIKSLANPSAYWVQIDGRGDENFTASIDAIVQGQSILIQTDNVDAYTLNLELAPLDCNKPVDIIENNEHLNTVTSPAFVRKSLKYDKAVYMKNKSLHGPVTDVFTDQYAVVWKGDESIGSLAQDLAGSGPCFADANLPKDFMTTHNIIFVGRLDKSEHFAEIAEKLPAVIEDGRLTANGRVYEGDYGSIFIYPNPLNHQKYLAILSGSTDKALEMLNRAWKQIKTRDNADIGIFKISENNRVDWLIYEKFNTAWNWHESWGTPLAELNAAYPKWKWQRLVARILRERLKADVVILGNPFNSAELPGTGMLTLRDISRVFVNDWIVKISLKGSELKKILTTTFNDISLGHASGLIIDGVSMMMGQQSYDTKSNDICVSELDNEKKYTICLHHKAVSGNKLGVFIDNYSLVDEGFLVVLLKEYLLEEKMTDINDELDVMQLNIF